MKCFDCLYCSNGFCNYYKNKKDKNSEWCLKYIDKKILNSKIIPYGDKGLKKIKAYDQNDCKGCFFLKFDSCVSPKGYPCEYLGKCWKYVEIINEQEG